MTRRLGSLRTGPWGWRVTWHLYAGAAAALVVLVVTLLLVVPASDSPHDQLVAEAATPIATVDVTPTPEATESPAPDASAEAPSPVPQSSPTPAASAPPPESHLTVDAAHLLSEDYVDRAFGSGNQGFVGTWEGPGAPVACTELVFNGEHPVAFPVARTWSWPGELVVGETFAQAASEEIASSALKACKEPAYGAYSPRPSSTTSLGLGDESFVWVANGRLASQALAGIRVGRTLVLIVWRRAGAIDDTSALVAAARGALAVARAEPQGAPTIAAPQAASEDLAGFVGYDDLRRLMNPEGRRWDGMSWLSDGLGQTSFSCDGDQEAKLTPAGPTTSRRWLGGVLNAMDGMHVVLSLAEDSDETTAVTAFEVCRQAGRGTAVPDLGDEAFVAHTMYSSDGEERTVFVRVGGRYVVLQSYNEPHEIEMARAAVEALTSAGRLS